MVTSNICFPVMENLYIYQNFLKPCSFVVFKLLWAYISEKTSSDGNNLVPLPIVLKKCRCWTGLDYITINSTTGVLRKYCQSSFLQAFIQSIHVCSVDCSLQVYYLQIPQNCSCQTIFLPYKEPSVGQLSFTRRWKNKLFVVIHTVNHHTFLRLSVA